MKAYYVEDLGLDEDEITDDGKAMRAKIYLAYEADAIIAELESKLMSLTWCEDCKKSKSL